MDAVTENLLRDLASSPTDLRKLVIGALWRDQTMIAIEADAIARWERDDPKRWESVRDWLFARGATITVLKSRSATPAPPDLQRAPEPPSAGLHA